MYCNNRYKIPAPCMVTESDEPSEPLEYRQFHQRTRVNVAVIVTFWLAYLVAHQSLRRWIRSRVRRRLRSDWNSHQDDQDEYNLLLEKRTTSSLARLLLGGNDRRGLRRRRRRRSAESIHQETLQTDDSIKDDSIESLGNVPVMTISHSLADLLAPMDDDSGRDHQQQLITPPLFEGIVMTAGAAVVLLHAAFIPVVCGLERGGEICRALLATTQITAVLMTVLLIPLAAILFRSRRVGHRIRRHWYEQPPNHPPPSEAIFFKCWIWARRSFGGGFRHWRLYLGGTSSFGILVLSWWLRSRNIQWWLMALLAKALCILGSLLTVPIGMLVTSLGIPRIILPTATTGHLSLGKRRYGGDGGGGGGGADSPSAPCRVRLGLEGTVVLVWYGLWMLLVVHLLAAEWLPLPHAWLVGWRILSSWTLNLCHLCGSLVMARAFLYKARGPSTLILEFLSMLALSVLAGLGIPVIAQVASLSPSPVYGAAKRFSYRIILSGLLGSLLYWRIFRRRQRPRQNYL